MNAALDHMERPTSACRDSRVTLPAGEGSQSRAAYKEVGHDGVYSHRRVRSACGVSRGGGAVPGTTDGGRARAGGGSADDPAVLERLGRADVRCCYEAGPCGFALQRHLAAAGIACDVIAPALIPRRAGNRVKPDRRDAAQLAVLYRAGALTAIHVPSEDEEAVRDLLRCREDVCADLLRAKHRLSKFLLRHDRRCPATRAGSKRYFAWLATQRWPRAALEQTFTAYRRGIDEAMARLRAVDADLRGALTFAARARRGGMALPASAGVGVCTPYATAGRPCGRHPLRVDGTASTAWALSTAARAGQTAAGGRNGRRP